MMASEDRKIIEEEIERLEKAYGEAQERYGITGSRSTDRTMTKYSILIQALEFVLNDERYARLEASWTSMLNRCVKAKQTIIQMAQAGRIPADVANVLTRILQEG